MRWSFRLAKVGETSLDVHVTFPLLLVWVAAVTWPQGGLPAVIDGIIFILLVFACVVLHEFGHVLMARRYGIRTPHITLLPIGGVASLERMPEKPTRELAVAIAGPLVNVAIVAVLFLAMGGQLNLGEMAEVEAPETSMATRLAAVNIIIIVFNLIPAFPLDGGRMLRAILAMRFDRSRATLYAARTGQVFAVLFAVIGLFGNFFLLIIAIFIFFAAQVESSQESMRVAVSGYRARDAMISRFESLGPDSTADHAGRLLLLTTQQEFPVLDGGEFQGMVTRQGLIEAMRETGPQTPVRDFMIREVDEVAETEELESIMQRISGSQTRIVAVRDRANRFLGYISAENAAELFMLSQAREAGRSA